MISSIFKNNDKIILLILPLSAIVITVFSFSEVGISKLDFNNSLILPFLFPNTSPIFVLKGLNLIFLLLGAYITHFMWVNQEVGEKNNFLSSLIYLVLGATLNNDNILHPVLIANIPVLIGLNMFLSIYRNDKVNSTVFDAAFLMGLATLIYFPFVFFFPIAFIALILLRTFNFREWVLIVMGFVLPLVLAITITWLIGSGMDFWTSIWVKSFIGFHPPEFKNGSFLINTIAFLLLIFSFFQTIRFGFGSKVKTKMGKYLLLWFFVLGTIVSFIIQLNTVFLGLMVIVPCSVFIGDFLGKIRKEFLADFLLLLLLAAFVFSHFQATSVDNFSS